VPGMATKAFFLPCFTIISAFPVNDLFSMILFNNVSKLK
jgi:hypothetical protein